MLSLIHPHIIRPHSFLCNTNRDVRLIKKEQMVSYTGKQRHHKIPVLAIKNEREREREKTQFD